MTRKPSLSVSNRIGGKTRAAVEYAIKHNATIACLTKERAEYIKSLGAKAIYPIPLSGSADAIRLRHRMLLQMMGVSDEI